MHYSKWLIKLQLSRNTCFPCHFPSVLGDKAALHSQQCYMMRSLFNIYPLARNKEDWLKEAPSHGLEQTQGGTSWCTTYAPFSEPVGIVSYPAKKRVYSRGFPTHTGIKIHTCTSWNLSVETYLSLQLWLNCFPGRPWTPYTIPSHKQSVTQS